MNETPSLETRQVTLSGEDFDVLFSWEAILAFEREAGYPVSEMRCIRGQQSGTELMALLTAGIAGAYSRDRQSARSVTPRRLLQLVGSASPAERSDALVTCMNAVLESFYGAGDDEQDEGDDEGKAAAPGASTGGS